MFITLEGIEGSGKTSQTVRIAEYLEQKHIRFILTREPGGTGIGRRIRSILLDPENRGMDASTEMLLYTADRAEHVRNVILPALNRGNTVVCDRYLDATLVYQGFARGIDIALIRGLHESVVGGLMPDLTFLLDLPPEMGLGRAWKQIDSGDRARGETRFEMETLAFHSKIRDGYLTLARLEPDRYRVVDATQSEECVRGQILEALSRENLVPKDG